MNKYVKPSLKAVHSYYVGQTVKAIVLGSDSWRYAPHTPSTIGSFGRSRGGSVSPVDKSSSYPFRFSAL